MTMKQQIDRELDRLSRAGDLSSSPVTLAVDVSVGRLESQMLAVDSLACAFESLTLSTDRLDGAAIDDLKSLSDRLAKQLNYLLEPISPVEVDADGCTVQMRSSPPQRDDDGSTYYELLVRRGQLSLSRFHKAKGAARTLIPAQLTREVFQRLAGDLVAAVK
ncbi:MAG: hypothetical protein RIC55_17820 [Pirellulaceae bacterium]